MKRGRDQLDESIAVDQTPLPEPEFRAAKAEVVPKVEDIQEPAVGIKDELMPSGSSRKGGMKRGREELEDSAIDDVMEIPSVVQKPQFRASKAEAVPDVAHIEEPAVGIRKDLQPSNGEHSSHEFRASGAEPVPDVKHIAEPAVGLRDDLNPLNTNPMQDPFDDEEEEEEQQHALRQSSRPGMRKGSECPYLDTISRHNLDFDFEKCCSVSLSPINVYACLVCGKYFQGRGPKTHAYTHSLETNHHMFMKLEDGRVYCLPDGYEVIDRSLDIIRFVLNPTFPPQQISRLDQDVSWSRALDGNEYMPGLLGLNNMKHNDYVNVLVQILSRVAPVRNVFLQPANFNGNMSPLTIRFGELLRKMWNPRNFKGQVSPHEFMQVVMQASQRRFTIDSRGDPVAFWSWFLNSLHLDLTGGKRNKASIISRCFQGELEIKTEVSSGGPLALLNGHTEAKVEKVPFFMLGLDLPPAPLYKDKDKKDIIPQVPIYELLKKFDGERVHDDIKLGRRQYRITKLPQYLVLHVKRFINNRYFTEKNPTIVNFPVKNLELKDIIPVPTGKNGEPKPSKYNLIANVVHDGQPDQGSYRVHMHRKIEDQWYEVENLRVVDILPQVVALSETYMQVYELKNGK